MCIEGPRVSGWKMLCSRTRALLRMASLLACGWVVFVLSPTEAGATDLSGTWNASSLRVSWSIGDWGPSCGPRPSGGGQGAGTVTLTPTGSDFKLSGVGRNYSSTQCWEQMPGLTPRGHSAGSSSIQTTCKMPTGDPRQATVVTTWSPRGDQLYFDETGQYQFLSKDSNCTASVRRTRVLTRVIEKPPQEEKKSAETQAEKPATKTPAPEPKSTPVAVEESAPRPAPPPPPSRADQCTKPGPPKLLEVFPKSKLMRAGETFSFEAVARDEAGCRVPVQATFRLDSGVGGELSPDGSLTVRPGASSGTLSIEASVGEQKVLVSARVVSATEYETLISGGDYGVMGESLDGAAIELNSSHVEFESQAEDTSRRLLLLISFGFLLLTGAGAFLVLRFRKPPRSEQKGRLQEELRDEVPVTPQPIVPESTPPTPSHPERLCPVCGQHSKDGSLFCGEDGARLVRTN